MTEASSRHIVITGFMGAGKTVVAQALAQCTGRTALDLDALVVNREQRSIHRIICEDGEARFRRIETILLREALTMHTAEIIALGGGAWTLVRNRMLIKQSHGMSVWLDVPFDLCWQRIGGQGGLLRPLAPNKKSARKLYDERRAFYQLAEVHVVVDAERSPSEVAAEIARVVCGSNTK